MKRLREILRDTCRRLIYVSCILGAAVSSCTDSDVGMTVTSGEDNGMPVLLSVSVARSTASGIMTKAPDDEDEKILNGWFSLVYPKDQNTNAVAVCPFKEGSGQIAYGYADSDTDFFTITPFKKSLRASDLYGKGVSNFRFIMDNVIAYEGDDHITNEQQPKTGLITFSEALKTRFSARLEQHQKSQFPTDRTESDASSDNDLVWGYAYTTGGSDRIPLDDQLTSLDFQLTHRMSRLSVVILDKVPENESATKHEDFINNAKDLDIWITNIVSTPTSFDRSTGTVNIPDVETPDRVYKSYYLWDHTDMGSITTNEDTNLSQKETDAANEGLAEDDTQRQSIKCYRSKNLILPPDEHVGQRTGDARPVLCVYYNKQLYSGVLPNSMTVVTTDSDGHPLQTSRSLAFSAGMHLLLCVQLVIENENPTIRFEPVQLIDWYEYGTYTVKGQEAGISSQEDLVDLITLYNGLQDANEQNRYKNMLKIYRKYAGPFNSDEWSIDVPAWNKDHPWCIPIYCNLSTKDLTDKFSKELFNQFPFTIKSNGWRIDRYCYEFDGHWYRLLYDEADDDPVKLTTEDKYARQDFSTETKESQLPTVLQEENTSSTFPTEGLPEGITPPDTVPLLK